MSDDAEDAEHLRNVDGLNWYDIEWNQSMMLCKEDVTAHSKLDRGMPRVQELWHPIYVDKIIPSLLLRCISLQVY